MYVRIVTFRLAGITSEEYAAHSEHIAARFAEWPGLIAKIWLADEPGGVFGGVYLFESRDEADLSRRTKVFAEMAANPVLADLRIREFETLAAPNAVTAALDDRAVA